MKSSASLGVNSAHTLVGCPIGIELLCKLCSRIEALPLDVGVA